MKQNEGCKVPGCKKEAKAKGYCSKHYMRARKYGTPTPPEIIKLCMVEGCWNTQRARGLCTKHYQQWEKGKRPDKFGNYKEEK